MSISRLVLALVLAGPVVCGQLPSIAERALKRQKQKEENEARHAAATRDAGRQRKPDPNAEQGVTGPLHQKYMNKVVF